MYFDIEIIGRFHEKIIYDFLKTEIDKSNQKLFEAA